MPIATSSVRNYLLDEPRLEATVASVLETMFFVPAEAFRPGLEGVSGQAVELQFHGAHPGVFGLVAPIALAHSLAANFHGLEGTALVSKEDADAVLLELCNVICGNLLSQLDAGELFCLDAPQLVERSLGEAKGAAADARTADNPSRNAANFAALSAHCEGEWLGIYVELH
jgi:hypothetical protein